MPGPKPRKRLFLSLRLSHELKARILTLARSQDRTASYIVNSILEKVLLGRRPKLRPD